MKATNLTNVILLTFMGFLLQSCAPAPDISGKPNVLFIVIDTLRRDHVGLVRRFLLKKTDFDKLSYQELTRIEYLLNSRPQKCLKFRTP